MKKIFQENYIYLLFLFTFMLLSITSIYSATLVMPKIYRTLYLKELLFYAIAFILFILLRIINNYKIFRYIDYIYIANIFLLILVLFIGKEINGTKAWIDTPVFSIQPSELVKISLPLILCKEIYNYNFKNIRNYKTDLLLTLKIILLTLIPCILVFIEPDTGSVISYLIIMIITILISNINKKLIYLYITISIILIISFILIYNYVPSLITNTLGSDIYYRINRLLDWKNSSGMQLTNSLISIGSAYYFGKGFLNTPLYFPEPYTDFIFSVYASNYGFIGVILFFILIILFLLIILENARNIKHHFERYLLISFFIIFLVSYVQNISMTFGLLPITGITLPFISYGGSSLIVYTIILSILNNIKNNKNL